MGATNKTTTRQLPIFVDADKPTWRGDFNGAMNLIEAELNAAQARDTTIDTRVTTEVANLNGKIDLNVAEIGKRSFYATVLHHSPTTRVVKDWESNGIPAAVIATVADGDRVWCQQDATGQTVVLGAIKDGDTGWVDVPLTDTTNFEPYQAGEQIQVRRIGNTVECRFQLRLKTAAFIDGFPDVDVAVVPKGFRPASRPRYSTGLGEGANRFAWSVTQTTGTLRMCRYGPGASTVGAWLRGNMTWTTREQSESDFGQVFGQYKEGQGTYAQGTDYQVTIKNGTKPDWSTLAIHGGGIEIGTSECAVALADATNCSYYNLDSKLPSGNSVMHVTSTLFDDPRALWVVKPSRRCVSWHGAADVVANKAETFVGGLDTALRDQVILALQGAGFTASIATNPEILGVNPDNIANKTSTGLGVQLELTTQQRKNFFPNGDYSRSVRESGARSAAFGAYINAVKQALITVT